MNRKLIAGALAGALVLVFGPVAAQEDAAAIRAGDREVTQHAPLDRDAVIEVILGTWEGSEHAVDGEGRLWRESMLPVLQGADEANLRRAMDALEYPSMLAALQGKLDGPTVTPSALGDPSSDLVYTPIEPCRILDTRVAGSAIAADGTRNFDGSPFVTGNFSFQGGSDTDCGIPNTRPSAVVLNITAVNPQGAGYLTAYPYGGTAPLAASLNYVSGDVIGNEVLATMNPSGTYDFTIYSFRQVHVVADAVGYFMAPEATTLDCTIQSSGDLVIAAGGRTFQNVACPAGYIAMGGGPLTPSNAGMRVEASAPNGSSWFISLANDNATSRTSEFRARCCRIPGR